MHAALHVSGILSIFNYRHSAKLQKELVDHNESGCVPLETSVICSVVRFNTFR